jgi:hypothetical protein
MRVSADRLVSVDAIFSSAKTPIVPQFRNYVLASLNSRRNTECDREGRLVQRIRQWEVLVCLALIENNVHNVNNCQGLTVSV